jgi:phosphate transport system substrate-binding protein
MKRLNKILVLALLFPAFVLMTSCNNKKATNSSTMGLSKILCDGSFQNIMEQEIEVFEYSYPEANVLPRYMDEDAALDSLLKKKTDLIVVARDLTPAQKKILNYQGRAYRSRKIAVDAVAIIVNKQNDIDELSMSDLSDIFNGKVSRWGEVYPTKLKNDSIRIVFDGSGSGVTRYIQDKFLGGKKFGKNVYAQKSTEDVFKAIEAHKNAIGFVGVSWISADMKNNVSVKDKVEDLKTQNDVSAIDFTNRIKVMSIRADNKPQGVKPYQAYIFDGSYPLFRIIYAIDASAGGTLDHGFYSFLTGVIGQKIILQTGILPAAAPIRYVSVQ